MQSLDSLLSDFSEAFFADDFQDLIFLRNSISEHCSDSPELQSVLSQHLPYSKFAEDLSYYTQSITHLYNTDWELVSDANNIKVETHLSGADFYTRASVLINSNIFETLSVITEEDLLPSWYSPHRIHALSSVEVLSAPARFKKLMKYTFWFPWPLSNRECFLEFSGYPVPDDQAMLIVMRSPQQKYMGLQIPAAGEEVQRMSVPLGCIYVQYISPSVTKVCILVQANATCIQASILPDWLLNFGKKQMMYFLMDALRIAVTNFRGSEYENRVSNRTDYYDFLRRVLRFDVEIV